ncbi:MAG TPA: hypothetical protein VEL51_18605 [Vicinamibacterales bacterium]|nr:hypothetical protein [Vicinamibacterales bacterium]
MHALLTFRIALFAGLMVAGRAAPIAAQGVTPTFEDLRADAHRGETVYVTDQAGKRVKGRVVRISPASIELVVKGSPREWRASDVAWITERHRHAGRGALIGLAIGATAGALLVVADSSCENSHYEGCGGDDAGYALVFAALFGGMGGGAGAAVGAAIRSEHVLYVAARPRTTSHVLAPIVSQGIIGVRAQLRF